MLRENLSAVRLQDFGEYQESYYSVQTTEGEQISQLIAGYIDIILKKVRLFFFFFYFPASSWSHHQAMPLSLCTWI